MSNQEEHSYYCQLESINGEKIPDPTPAARERAKQIGDHLNRLLSAPARPIRDIRHMMVTIAKVLINHPQALADVVKALEGGLT